MTFAEYMLLGPIFDTRRKLKTWLADIQRQYSGSNCKVGAWPSSLAVDSSDLPE